MSFLRGRSKRAYGEPADGSVNVFLLVVALAAITLLCFLVYALVAPLLFGEEEQFEILPYGSDVTPIPPPTLTPGAPLPTHAPATATPAATAALVRIAAGNAAGLAPVAKLSGHSNPVSSVAYSRDGRYLVSGDWEGTVRLWNTTTQSEVARFRSPSNRVDGVAFSPDGRQVAAVGQDTLVRRWDIATGTELAALSGPTAALNAVAYSPDGSLLAAASDDARVYVWRLPGGEPLIALAGHTSYVTCLAFTPDGTQIAAGGEDDTIRLWSLPGGTPVATLQGHASAVSSIAFSPDGTTLASTGLDHTVRLWNLLSESQTAVLSGHTEIVNSVAYSPDGSLLASGAGGIEDNTVRLWDARSGALLGILYPDGPVNAVAFAPDGTRLVTGGATFLALWGATGAPQAVAIPTPTQPAAPAIVDGQGGAVCALTVLLSDAVLRSGPGDDYAAVGTLAPGQSVQADGWATGADGYTWWRLSSGGWARGDVFVSADSPTLPEACWTLPPVQDTAAPAPTSAPQGVVAPTQTPASGACALVVRWSEANLRAGPGTDYAVVGKLTLDQTVAADGWATGADGFTWWRLASGGWARGDVFIDAANPNVPAACLALPSVAP